jgi:type II secretory pathway pseudopilin PulG
MVVSIIALLLALLVPAVSSVLHSGKKAQVVSDIQGLANAADSFKAQYHVYPPSSITLYETSAGWANDTTGSRALIRRIFGTEFDFNNAAGWDINGNGTAGEDDPDGDGTLGVTLNGQQCLVFFLGGMPVRDTSTGTVRFTLIGFSANRRNPFDRTAKSRTQFFKSFDASRLSDPLNRPASDSRNGMPVYHDIFNPPGTGPAYAYISTTNASNAYISGHLPSGMTSYYHQGNTNSPWKPDGFQIISAGPDHEFGIGGRYTEADGVQSDADRDNITNFAGGSLAE